MQENIENFMKDYLWLITLLIVLFTGLIGYILNTNNDNSECDGEEEGTKIDINYKKQEDEK